MNKRHARVKDILACYRSGGMVSVARYLSADNIIITEDTWEHKMKKLLDSNNWASMEAEIASLSYIFNLTDTDAGRNKESHDQGSEDNGDMPDSNRRNSD
jgi:Trk K+ transport system NAD-binding subunit